MSMRMSMSKNKMSKTEFIKTAKERGKCYRAFIWCITRGYDSCGEKRIPFEVSADPFYSESNLRYLEDIMEDIKSGKASFQRHELLEDD